MAPCFSSPVRHSRQNSPFSHDQASWVILKFGELNSLSDVRRAFRLKFFPKNPRYVPDLKAFKRLVQRFETSGATRPLTPRGRTAETAEEVERVKTFFQAHPDAHVRKASQDLGMSFGKVWTILRKKLHWKPYRPILTTVLSADNMASRLEACTFWLSQAEGWFERVIWSDEKWFMLQQAPNRKNTVFWSPMNPQKLTPCKKAHGAKVMAWVGIVDGSCLPVYWFEGPVTGAAYLEMLKTVVWPSVRAQAAKRGYWFQQDGAPVHVTSDVMDFLKSKFGDRLISRKAQHPWPPYSPDLSCLDFSFWPQAAQEVAEQKPETLAELKDIVEGFARRMAGDQLRRMARHTRRRAELCCAERGGHFEHLL